MTGGSSVWIQFSTTGSSGWHNDAADGDVYIRFALGASQPADSSVDWSTGIRFVGDDGDDGAAGAAGAPGAAGAAGARGEAGAAGDDGNDGAPGAAGDAGAAGAAGARGEAGAAGARGEQGIQGAAGDDGDDGAAGAAGAPGAAGARGAVGADGARGEQGDQGAAGDDGDDGAAGAAGARGEQGIQGAAGDDGDDGADGALQQGTKAQLGTADFSGVGNAANNDVPLSRDPAAGTSVVVVLDQTGDNAQRSYYFEADAYLTGDLIIGKDHRNGAPASSVWGHSSYSIQRLSATSLRFIHTHSSTIDPFTLTVREIPTGAQGAAGDAGPAGDDGDDGAAGARGAVGAQGAQGIQGVAGNDGNDGNDGAAGARGDVGAQGDQGAAGAAGARGDAGADGAAGAQGIQGDAGAAGADGEDGDDGAAGARGEQGIQGDQGAAGEDGDDGAAGARGEQGDAGAAGARGDDGDDGAAGARGEQGIQGDAGAAGEDGDDGADGALQQGTKAELGTADFSAVANGASNDVTLSRDPAAGTSVVVVLDQTGVSHHRNYYFEADAYLTGDLVIGKDHRNGAPASTVWGHSSYSIQRLSATVLRFIHSHASAIDPFTLTVIEIPTGAQGAAGEDGDDGAAGAAGARGAAGAAGAQGDQGAAGDDGDDGAAGAAGAPGAAGAAGARGEAGADGEDGADGAAGAALTASSPYGADRTFSAAMSYQVFTATGWRTANLIGVSIDVKTGAPSTWQNVQQHAIGTVAFVDDLTTLAEVAAGADPNDARAWKFGDVPAWYLAPTAVDDELALACSRALSSNVHVRVRVLG